MAKKNNLKLLGGVAVAVIAAGAFAAFQWSDHNKAVAADRAVAQAYQLDGPPCETLTAAAFTTRRNGRKGTTFAAETGQFIMGFGNSECRAFNTGVGKEIGVDYACRFNNPGWIQVTTDKGAAYFSAARTATVAVKDGTARCTLSKAG